MKKVSFVSILLSVVISACTDDVTTSADTPSVTDALCPITVNTPSTSQFGTRYDYINSPEDLQFFFLTVLNEEGEGPYRLDNIAERQSYSMVQWGTGAYEDDVFIPFTDGCHPVQTESQICWTPNDQEPMYFIATSTFTSVTPVLGADGKIEDLTLRIGQNTGDAAEDMVLAYTRTSLSDTPNRNGAINLDFKHLLAKVRVEVNTETDDEYQLITLFFDGKGDLIYHIPTDTWTLAQEDDSNVYGFFYEANGRLLDTDTGTFEFIPTSNDYSYADYPDDCTIMQPGEFSLRLQYTNLTTKEEIRYNTDDFQLKPGALNVIQVTLRQTSPVTNPTPARQREVEVETYEW